MNQNTLKKLCIVATVSKKDKDGFCAVSLKKTKEYSLEVNPKDSFGRDDCWRWGKELVAKNIDAANTEKNNVVAKQRRDGGWNIYEKHRKTTQKVKSIWDDASVRTESGTIELGKVLGKNLFPHPKPVELIKRVLRISTKSNDIIVDFFSGSATTAQAVLELNKEDSGNRQFVLCEQLDYVDTVTIPRVKKVIKKQEGEDFIYCELMKWNEAYIDKIQKAKTKTDLIKIWQVMKEKGHLSYKLDFKEFDKNASDFEQLDIEDQRKFLLEVLDKNQLYVNYCEIEDADYRVSTEDKKLNKLFYKE